MKVLIFINSLLSFVPTFFAYFAFRMCPHQRGLHGLARFKSDLIGSFAGEAAALNLFD